MRALLGTWQVRLGIALVVLSAIGYCVHFLIFRDLHHIFLYLVGDIAFVFLEVLLVTLIIHELLSNREKLQRLQKLNMVIGAFFSEVGTGLLRFCAAWDSGLPAVREQLKVSTLWGEAEFEKVEEALRGYHYRVEAGDLDVGALRPFVTCKRDFLLRLMENPNLLEHERFTSLLMAVFHLTEELMARTEGSELPESDLKHLAGDVDRVYDQLARVWLEYMRHLKRNYPYLFSLAVRTNPFDASASPIVR